MLLVTLARSISKLRLRSARETAPLPEAVARGSVRKRRAHAPAPDVQFLLRSDQQPRWISGSLRERLAGDGIDETRFRRIMAALGVPGPVPEGPIEAMSYGQQKKVELARAFLNPVDLLVLDEPLNFIDIDARELIEDAVRTRGYGEIHYQERFTPVQGRSTSRRRNPAHRGLLVHQPSFSPSATASSNWARSGTSLAAA